MSVVVTMIVRVTMRMIVSVIMQVPAFGRGWCVVMPVAAPAYGGVLVQASDRACARARFSRVSTVPVSPQATGSRASSSVVGKCALT